MNNTVSQKSRGTRVSRISMPRFCILDQLFLFRSAHHKAQQFAILCAPGWYTTGLNKSQKMPKDQQSKLKVWSKLTPMLETSESRYAFIDKSCTKSDKCSHYTVRSPVSCTRTEVIGDLRKKSPFQNACGHPFHTLQYNHILTIIFGRIKSTTGWLPHLSAERAALTFTAMAARSCCSAALKPRNCYSKLSTWKLNGYSNNKRLHKCVKLI